jgi:hypothetical protein
MKSVTIARPLMGALLLLTACACGSPVRSVTDVGEVSMTWSGGITGDVTSVIVLPDGQVETQVNSDPSTTTQMAATDLTTLHALVASSEFDELAPTYVSNEGVCCDRFTYTVVAVVDDASRQSTTADGLDSPTILTDVIQLLLTAAGGQ